LRIAGLREEETTQENTAHKESERHIQEVEVEAPSRTEITLRTLSKQVDSQDQDHNRIKRISKKVSKND
jgi:hypothetical protein